jgi:hypothetical protein
LAGFDPSAVGRISPVRRGPFQESTFEKIGTDPAALKNFGDLPGEPPQVYRVLEPPPGTPIQRGIVPGGQFGGEGQVPEVYFPEGF